MTSLEIRKAEPAELPEAVALWERSRWDAQPRLEERMAYTHEQNLRQFVEVIARECEIWLALREGAIVGLLALRGDRIDQLYVEPQAQRTGVGSALLNRAKELVPEGLALFTHQRNLNARAFYESQGFEVAALGVSPPPESEPDVEFEWRPLR